METNQEYKETDMIQRLQINFSKDLNRLEFLKSEVLSLLICTVGVVLVMIGLGMAIPSTSLDFITEPTSTEIAAGSLIAILGAILVVYTSVLSASNINGRFTNLGLKNKVVAWVIYILVKVTPHVTVLSLVLYILPPGLFNNKENKSSGEENA